jgi:hypothetical protein
MSSKTRLHRSDRLLGDESHARQRYSSTGCYMEDSCSFHAHIWHISCYVGRKASVSLVSEVLRTEHIRV